ncbi:hypothetical protein M569_07870 [Genlisea aurea]|uniref:Alpha-taxilin n=1 Tax=Genlisea aurea TaxID=192259 RepID=S8E3S6_9LAMI|nr:hypothetical protein M569_07870 [Genlisea aurea]
MQRNLEVDRLPEADSLPDGFVESSPLETSEETLADYREEILVDPDRLPELLTGGFDSVISDYHGNLSRPSGSTAVEDIDDAPGVNLVKEKNEKGSLGLLANASEDASMGQSAENNKKELPEVKRKNSKRNSISDKDLLEFTLKYQKIVAERDSAVAVRDKLESLCRELQRQNKLLMDECRRVSTEGQNLRLDLSNKFQDAIKEVSSKLEEQKDESISQLKENEMLKTKLKQLVDQYTFSEQEHAHQMKQKTLELQLADLKLHQQEENLKQEQSQMKLYSDQVSQLLETEKNLRLQLTADSEKFQHFQEALLKSNEVFETFKKEIEKASMANSIKELKKENTLLKSKCEKTDVTLIQLADEREQLKKQLERTKNQKEKLESLCRSLRQETKTNSGSSKADSTPPA